jgi:hypothetical protein
LTIALKPFIDFRISVCRKRKTPHTYLITQNYANLVQGDINEKTN